LHRSIGTRLGANLKERGKLDPDGVSRTLAVIDEYAIQIGRNDADAGAIATSAMRRASDGAAFAAEVEARIGAPLEIIAGRREAELSFRGATANVPATDGIVGVLDVGGGSSEYAYGRERAEGVVSCEIGAVRLSEAIPALLGARVPPDPDALERQARVYARDRLSPLRQFPRPRMVLAVGGTMFNAASMIADVDREKIDGVVLTRDALTELARRFLRMDTVTRRAQPRISAQRADILPAGILIVDEALGFLDVSQCTISQADLLYGYLVEKYQHC
jgi:exopolyphosphatase/guanosine-5'-triphosphate,3'-diphosphate pyrophosphatase